MNSLFDLKGKVILITGGSGHLGSSITLGLAKSGATVYILDIIQKEHNLSAISNTLDIQFIATDITKKQEIFSSFKKVFEAEGKIDVLINNAFYAKGYEPENISDEDWAYSMDGILGSIYRCSREVIPFFIRQGYGKIINMASMYGLVAPDFNIYNIAPEFTNPPHYGAAKAGVIQLTKYFASLLGKHNIIVNAVSPGPFPNPDVQQKSNFIDLLAKKTVLGRIGQPEDLQGIFVYLCSDSSNFMTGQNIIIDGGWTIK